MSERDAGEDDTITRGTGNVLADLGMPDAEERALRLRLAHAVEAASPAAA